VVEYRLRRAAAARAQPAMPVIGFLNGSSPDGYAPMVVAFRRGLKETGYIEGQNATIEYRWAHGQYDRLLALAADLVRRQVTVIATSGGTPATLAAKAATTTIPIVFYTAADPVEVGFVASLSRPGGNLTGVTSLNLEVGPKRLELLRELVPTATIIAVLVNPTNPSIAENISRDLLVAARALGLQTHVLRASSASEIDMAFVTVVQQRAGALLVANDAFFNSRRDQFVALAAQHRLPTMYGWREFPAVGGLISYAASLADMYRQAGVYTGRILKGEKPADLPVQQTTKIELIINVKAATALGLKIPQTLLAIADEVIE
jgi:putative ABC transport system substrate-binding protein